ncbi:MAG: hypothetical protein IT159_03445 [Bryobacterales bacterium]|nr:hypothetical protein [Bryobacterales bacterium]
MQTSLLKTRIAVLWIVTSVAMSAYMILMAFDPAVMKGAAVWVGTAGEDDWLMVALFWLVPLWLVFLAVTLRDPVNRWVSFAVAVIFTIIGLWHFFICGVPLLKGGLFPEPVPHHVLLVGSSAAATALIALVRLEVAETGSPRDRFSFFGRPTRLPHSPGAAARAYR